MSENPISSIIDLANSLPNRSALATELSEFNLNDLEGDEIINFLIAGDRLVQIGEYLKTQISAAATEAISAHLPEGKSTVELFGEKITVVETKKYEYPADSQLRLYSEKLEDVSNRMEPLQVELKALKASISAREKQLQANLKPVEFSYTLKIAKS